ncbi:MAG TPA: hypothetical protein VGL61_03940 [Kofleriaceae bacterium]
MSAVAFLSSLGFSVVMPFLAPLVATGSGAYSAMPTSIQRGVITTGTLSN